MKQKKAPNAESNMDTMIKESDLHKARVTKILDTTLYRLKLMSHLPNLLKNDGAILRFFLSPTEADFIVLVCEEQSYFSRNSIEDRQDLVLICDVLERINLYERKGKGTAAVFNTDHFDTHIAFCVETIMKCKPLVEYLETLGKSNAPGIEDFIDAVTQLREVVMERIHMSAQEEVQRENDLKNAFRSSMMLSNSIEELEQFLEKQRQEFSKEHDRKEMILQELEDKLEALKEKCSLEINRIVYDSEVVMMKDYNKSTELQEELSQDAATATHDYETLLESHLDKEKELRIKRRKIETQLANWVAKYDTDIGEKQAEYDELEKTLNEEKENFDLLQDKFDEQEPEYNFLMREKEEEEQRIMEEKAWIFLQNRSARRIQRGWRAYRARKLARRKGRKGKKKGEKGGSGGSKKGGKKMEPTTLRGGPDPNALLEGKFGDDIIGEMKTDNEFVEKQEVDLMET